MSTSTTQRDRQVGKEPRKAAPPCLRVSFEYLDWDTSAFFAHGLDAGFYHRLFACLQSIQSATRDQIAKQTHPSLTCKAIFRTNTGTHAGFPQAVIDRIASRLRAEQFDLDAEVEALQVARHAFEVSMGKNQGRLHGFLWNRSFNLVWIDPAHNLYPGERKLRGPRELMQLRSGSHEEVLRVSQLNLELVNEINALKHDIDQLLAK